MIKKKYKVKGMDCDACAKMIELDLEDNGFTACCNFAKETLEVEITNTGEEEKVLTTVKISGYELTEA